MKKTLFVHPLALLLILLGMPGVSSAKGPTAKIVITGGGLTKAIEVTDSRILDISNVWAGQFLDRSRGTAKEPPRELPRYEVSFFVKLPDNDVRRMYVVYYCPNPSAQQGYIYLPGKGEPWYSLNVRTIIRNRQDGKWNYASPAWEAVIKRVIAGAEPARRPGSGPNSLLGSVREAVESARW